MYEGEREVTVIEHPDRGALARDIVPAEIFDKVHTVIKVNGSKWGGQRPDGIAVLLDVLARETLDRRFENYGDFSYPLADDDAEIEARLPGDGWIHFFGNFLGYSHAFGIDSRDAETVDALVTAIKANKQTVAYQQQERPTQLR